MTQMTEDGKRDKQTYVVMGAVHSELGFLEPTSQEALLLNFRSPRLDYKRLVFNLRPSAQSADEEDL